MKLERSSPCGVGSRLAYYTLLVQGSCHAGLLAGKAHLCVCVCGRACVCGLCVCAKRECTCCTGKYHQRGNNQGVNAKREKIAHKPGQYNVGTQIQQTRTVSCGLVLRRYSTLHHRKKK